MAARFVFLPWVVSVYAMNVCMYVCICHAGGLADEQMMSVSSETRTNSNYTKGKHHIFAHASLFDDLYCLCFPSSTQKNANVERLSTGSSAEHTYLARVPVVFQIIVLERWQALDDKW